MPEPRQQLDPEVATALYDLMAFTKPHHDEYFIYAVAADAKELKTFKKYIRRRSHEKGEQWKSILFFLNDFIDIREIPGTPAFPCNRNLDVEGILDAMSNDEEAIREAVEKVISLARFKNENRVIEFLVPFVVEQTHHENKLARLTTLWEQLHDVYEWQKCI